MQSSEARESRARFDGGTYTLRPKSGDRKSLVDDGRWLSLDRRGSTQAKQTSGSSVTSAAVSAETKNGTSHKRSVSRSPSRAKSREKSRSPSRGKSREKSSSPSRRKSQDASDQEERDARSFWVSMDSSQAQEARKSSSMSRKTSEKQSSKKLSRASADRKISDEPPVDYDQGDSKKSKNSKIKRGSQVTKRQMESSTSNAVSESAFSSAEQQRYNMNTVNNEDYNRGTNYPMVKHSTGVRQESNGDTLKRNSTSLSRRGTIIDSNINRDGFGRDNEHNNAVAIRSRNGSNANDSKHFLSLQLFNKVLC